ncbi:MAG: endolytic transglycosylase MltG [bacterium]|nr:endolytic transglycosylase MltG [bacterium]
MDELIRELKSAGVLGSPYVEAAFRAIDRKDFVPPEHLDEAYGNYPLPIGAGQTISQPYTVAFMLDLLDPRPGEKILDVGAGSGWQTTLLAHVVSGGAEGRNTKDKGKVYAVERIPELCDIARANVSKYDFIKSGTVELHCEDATNGLPDAAPFDKIVAAAAGGELPAAWREQLKIGGTIVAPIGSSIWRYTKRGPDQWDREEFPGFAFVPLITKEARSTKHEARNGRMDGGRRRFPKRFWGAIFLVAIAAYAAAAPVSLTGPVRVEIAPGAGSRAIAAQLKSYGLIRSKWTFTAYAAFTGRASALKPGAYEFRGRVGVPGVVTALVRGEPYPNERFITIPEGWDLRDIGNYLEANGIALRRDLYAITGEPARRYDTKRRFPPPEFPDTPAVVAAKAPSAILEGWLYPDTYRVFRDASAADIVAKMLLNFDRKLTPDLRAEIRRQGKSVADVITMASLIEKEVADAEDRSLVSDILWGRLDRGMPLQVDATINYITGKHETPSAEDLAIDSPYNTYRNRGLPPTPIANPGIDAVQAAISPRANDFTYYLSTPDGRTIFSRTLEEHAGAKTRYLR